MKWTIAIAILTAGSILLGACGGSDSRSSREDLDCCRPTGPAQTVPTVATPLVKEQPQPEKGKVDPCALITKADAEQLLGETVKDAHRVAGGSPLGQTICSYTAVADLSFSGIQVSVIQTESMDAQLRGRGYTAKQLFNDSKKMDAFEAVSGIGDDAYARGTGSIEVLKGNVMVHISVTGPRLSTAFPAETITTLARTAVARIGN